MVKLLVSSAFSAVSCMEDFDGVLGMSDTSESSCAKSRHLGGVAEANNCVSEGCASADDIVCARPIMPDTAEDGGDVVSLDISPRMLPGDDSDAGRGLPSREDAIGGLGSVCVESGSPYTPEVSVFDPFAAGECDNLWASLSKKLLDDLSGCVARRFNFGCSVIDIEDDVTQATDEEIVNSVYRNLLEAIVMQQADEILACISRSGMDLGSCLTPTSFPLLNGIANTCPGAPIKYPSKSRVIKWGLRRKLDF